MLALKETIKTISKEKKVTQLEMAETLGISKQNFSNKIQRNTFSPDELVKIADRLGMELAFIDKDAEIKNGTKYVIMGAEWVFLILNENDFQNSGTNRQSINPKCGK